ncbi:MAG: hypothetical protein MUF00_18415 [Gemmatimonadaceae bacterium]|jgi:hypothetical protein|nr:hypothetical protein [Gemmatimonadaceae bacterium]
MYRYLLLMADDARQRARQIVSTSRFVGFYADPISTHVVFSSSALAVSVATPEPIRWSDTEVDELSALAVTMHPRQGIDEALLVRGQLTRIEVGSTAFYSRPVPAAWYPHDVSPSLSKDQEWNIEFHHPASAPDGAVVIECVFALRFADGRAHLIYSRLDSVILGHCHSVGEVDLGLDFVPGLHLSFDAL